MFIFSIYNVSKGGAALPSIGFIRLVRRAVFVVDAMTVLCAVLFVGSYKNWRDLPLSFVFNTQKHTDAALLQLPIIILLLLAAAFLTAFYLWLHDTEIRLTRANR
jgi:glucan phosphoethanolaminetransferase (alkaline phosphatase superfamily)